MAAKHASPVQSLLVDSAFDGEVLVNEPMGKHTTYRIGGPASFYVRVDSLGCLSQLVRACVQNGVPYFIAGRGSNLLVSDDGFDGVVITLGRDFRNHEVRQDAATIVAGSGVLLSTVVQDALRSALSGMEFAVGTPGSLGGALKMNAGSADDWIGSRVRSVTSLAPDGSLVKRMGSDVDWGYRRTSFPLGEAILECELVLKEGDPFLIQGKMEGSLARRKKTQPLDLPSCGSVFRNPEGASAAKMIDELGLKGTQVGGAQISTKHGNFIVNTGGAKAADVVALIELAKDKVEQGYGIELTPEVKFLGF